MSFKFVPDKNVEVPELPFKEKIDLPANRSAVVVVDMQNDFVRQEGSLVTPAAKDTLPYITDLVETARQAGVKIVYTQDTAFPGDREFEIWPQHCLEGTWGWEIVDELKPREEDLICQKNRYDGFYGTWLEHFLSHVWDISHLVIVGTVANICVLHTAASAGLRWYHVVMPANGISAQTQFDQALTLHQVGGLYSGTIVKKTEQVRFK